MLPPHTSPSTITVHPAGDGWYRTTMPTRLSSPGQTHMAPSGFEGCWRSRSSAVTSTCSWQVTETHCQKGLGSVVVLLFQMFIFFPP